MAQHNFFDTIHSEANAYLLGWIISFEKNINNDNLFITTLDNRDSHILDIYNTICPVNRKQGKFVFENQDAKLSLIPSRPLTDRILELFNLDPSQKQIPGFSKQIWEMANFPVLSVEHTWIFIRALFDLHGSYGNSHVELKHPSENLLQGIFLFLKNLKFSPVLVNKVLTLTNTDSIDFLGFVYPQNKKIYIKTNNFFKYLLPKDEDIPLCKFFLDDEKAVVPQKGRASEEGYDLTLIKIDKVISKNTVRYDTGIKIQPPFGYYTEIVPRSSISNFGYVLSNSLGIVDKGYRGTLKVTLTRVDHDLPELELPFKAAQLLLKPSVHFNSEVTIALDSTLRAAGGFGSTNTEVMQIFEEEKIQHEKPIELKNDNLAAKKKLEEFQRREAEKVSMSEEERKKEEERAMRETFLKKQEELAKIAKIESKQIEKEINLRESAIVTEEVNKDEVIKNLKEEEKNRKKKKIETINIEDDEVVPIKKKKTKKSEK